MKSVAATNIERYSIPENTICTVRDGLAMIVRSGFQIRGAMVLKGGALRVKNSCNCPRSTPEIVELPN